MATFAFTATRKARFSVVSFLSLSCSLPLILIDSLHLTAHYDDDCQSNGAVSEWTLLIYLTGKEDGVVGASSRSSPLLREPPLTSLSPTGGETAFYPNPSRKGNGPAIVPELLAGRALLHRHGQLCSLHEGRLVEKGTKYVLRSDVMFR